MRVTCCRPLSVWSPQDWGHSFIRGHFVVPHVTYAFFSPLASFLVFFAEPISVEGDERGGSEVCVCPRHHDVSASTASPLCLVSGSCSHQQPAGAGAALPGLWTQEGKLQHWTQRFCIAQKSCSTPSTGLVMFTLLCAWTPTEAVWYCLLWWWPLKSIFASVTPVAFDWSLTVKLKSRARYSGSYKTCRSPLQRGWHAAKTLGHLVVKLQKE